MCSSAIRTALFSAMLVLLPFDGYSIDVDAAGGPSLIIPRPAEYAVAEGVLPLHESIGFFISSSRETNSGEIGEFVSYLEDSGYGFYPVDRKKDAVMEIFVGRQLEGVSGKEAYNIRVTPKKILVSAETVTGAFYACQSIFQMIVLGDGRGLQCCDIHDSPRFRWRGMHFDVSRHFRSKEFIMKQLDAMALFRMNKAHLHLTDAAGWRLKIESYPRLTGYAAWRPYEKWTDWSKNPVYATEGTEGAYGGYYTKEDIKEIIEYARVRHIDVIPEIEMPGHSEEVTAAYPELSCSGKPSDLCPGNEKTFEFLESVLGEVMELFPSEYVHIGGDEAGKGNWKTCPLCRKRMEEEGLKDVDGLQSYLIHRVEAFVNSKGKKIIGWDEILQGGLAPNATVMSWRGTEGGVQAMKAGHDVIMTPGRYCYLDYTQDAPFKEPASIGGYTPLDTVYLYEPVEASVEEIGTEHLLGVQANLWAEYIPSDSHCEYMYWPRALAIAETGWSRPEHKDLKDFRSRVEKATDFLEDKGYTVFDIRKEYGERHEAMYPLKHLAVGKKVYYNIPANGNYLSSGETALVDGICGGWTYGDRKWQGFHSDIDVTVDLGEIKDIHYIGATFMQLKGPYVFMPEKVEIYASEDGEEFSPVGTISNDISTDNDALLFKPFSVICNTSARYVRYRAYRGEIKEWLFTDEIVIN